MNKVFYNLPKAEKINLFEELRIKTGFPPYAIEKDWWVTLTLSLIFEMEMASHLLFKSGTVLKFE